MNSVKVNYAAVGITLVVVLVMTLKMYHTRVTYRLHTVNLKELLSVSIDLAELGGERVVAVKQEHKLHAESKGETKEGKQEMKTDGDMQSHRTILAGFHTAFPWLDSRIVSEEHDKHPDTSQSVNPNKKRPETDTLPDLSVLVGDITIWVDPLDATQEYTENLDEYVTVMVCVAVKGEPVIGVVHRPQQSDHHQKETVWAWVGQGVSSNLGSIGVQTDAKAPDAPIVIISRSHAGSANQTIKQAFGKGHAVPAGGAGYKSIEVIRGKADMYAHVTVIKKWDICPGNALFNAVGGHMMTLKGEIINYDKSGSPVNEHGLLASVNNFQYFLNRLGPVFDSEQKR
ncbi:Golgi-resident adenosine 3',5'-bisphosphate 3'-phosphatase-like [Watersipora subatra]|uniref:Golgi-resident adenosine 3',5'-bisphosphate 3'-phosphatase-like n=1 Tax=Watersipora subatra TaxID=2589382 RepID=UPI00355C413B